ncbi:TonB-dependent receptor [Flavobacterium sp. HJJ]|uniref:TonB-dependent receptor n=1 Tax=Flavobacterium sp. HJJ TaxID=2783792 RepID=UPI00188B8396|nr:TonB-dependent receptor [Flavobacterium sp. HJJ]MBF4472560.1 TonB-dependent receptor [Flavobacterium sp. HJJ]
MIKQFFKSFTKITSHLSLLFTAISFLLISGNLIAQTTPSAVRNVTGILRDSLSKPISGADIRLVSAKDTLKVTTNVYGFFGFNNVHSADFLISVKALGHQSFNRKYFNNDTKKLINLPPIRLGIKEEQLENVIITRMKGPTIKGDTTEFWAKDYIVRDFARLEDLLKRMEGIRIDPNGTVFYNDEVVVKALFNGVNYFSGSVKEAMKELPADIIERIQIIDMDESGNIAKMQKTDKSSKVLNIVTKADKSAGRMLNFTGESGSESRTRIASGVKNIDQSNQFSANGNYQEEPLGIRSTRVPGSLAKQNLNLNQTNDSNVSDGQLKNMNAGIAKNFNLKKINFFSDLSFSRSINNNSTRSIGENYYKEGSLYKETVRTAVSENNSLNFNNNFNSNFKDGSGFMGSLNVNVAANDANLSNQSIQSGLIDNFEETNSASNFKKLNYNFNTQYNNNIGQNLVLNFSVRSSYTTNKTKHNSITNIYKDTINTVAADSTLNQFKDIKSRNFVNSVRNELNWKYNKQLRFKASLEFQSNANLNDTDTSIAEEGSISYDPKLSYFQKEVTYHIPISFKTEYKLQNGLTIAPTFGVRNNWIKGEIGLEKNKVNRHDLLPETGFNISYNTPKFGLLNITVSQNFKQPSLNALNPIPNNAIAYQTTIGNLDLKNAEILNYNITYTKFFKKLQFNTSIMFLSTASKNGIGAVTSTVVDQEKNTLTTINTFANIDGQKSTMLNFNLGKSLAVFDSNFQLNGSIRQSNNPYFLNEALEMRKSISQNWKANFLFNPKKWLEINTELEYISQVDHNSASPVKTFNQLFNANANISLYFLKTWSMNFYLQQNLNQTSNSDKKMTPFVFNMNIEKRIFKQQNGIISFVIMDLIKQNYLINYNSTDNGYQQNFTNKNSNYFMLQFSWQPQKWGKSQFDNGKGRKGNGSFK